MGVSTDFLRHLRDRLIARPVSLLGPVLACTICMPLFADEHTGEAEANGENSGEEENRVATLLDDNTTKDLHDDTTLLRTVSVLDDRSLLLFDALRIWIGGAVQYDYYNFDGIFNHFDGGENEEGSGMRRFEATVRAQLLDWGELKAQYDLDDGIFRDLYLRWVSDRTNTPVTITVGNQKEPIGLDDLTGNKFGMAQERSAPSHAFGTWRSLGVRLHRAFQLNAEERKFDYFDEDTAFVTTSFGLFTEDIEETHETDLAFTARVTAGREDETGGMHIGVAGSYREGDFYRISFRPEVREANRITLARPESNTLGIAALEGAWNQGRLLLQAEAYYADYRGRVDGYGGGGYLQAGWFVTADNWAYNSRWGILAPHRPAGRYSVDVFARVSHTRGDDDINGWNDYKSLTLGSSFYFRKFRTSLNLVYGESREPIDGEEEGFAVNVRAQYLL